MGSRTFEVFGLACAVIGAFACASSAQITSPPVTDGRMEAALNDLPDSDPSASLGRAHHSARFQAIEETLTPDQKKQLAEIRHQLHADLAPLREQIRSIHDQLIARAGEPFGQSSFLQLRFPPESAVRQSQLFASPSIREGAG
jgi:hypothetical protein